MADIPGVLSVCPQYPQKKTTFRDAPVERRQGLMKKLMKILLSRLVLVGVLIILQIIWLLILFFHLGNYSVYIRTFLTVLSIIVALWIINKKDNPAYKLAWIVPILLLPILGGMMYLALGNKNPTRGMRRRLEHSKSKIWPLVHQDEEVIFALENRNINVAGQAKYLSRCGFPIYENSTARYFESGEACYPVMLEELKKAKHYIFMEYFIVADGTMWNGILEILKEKVKEGVDVRFIYDDVGCVTRLPYHYYKQMEAAGIKCIAFNPFIPVFSLAMNNRDHRKILVIDGHTGFSGGINLADEYINTIERFGYWKDTAIMVRGEAVWNFTAMFLQTWNAFYPKKDQDFSIYKPNVHIQGNYQDGFIQPYGDSPLDDEVVGESTYLNIINQASRYVYIFTPYLIIDNEMMTALCMAAKRGVDVRIVTPGIPDKKMIFMLTQSYYEQLLENGVRIYEYTPGFIHAKNFVADDIIATVGSINLDFRSLYLHFECGVYMYRTRAIMDVKKDAIDTIRESREIMLPDTRPGFFKGLFQAVLRVFAPLL